MVLGIDYHVVLYPLPGAVRGLTTLKNGRIVILINENLTEEARMKAYRHEIKHIINGDLWNTHDPVETLERRIK